MIPRPPIPQEVFDRHVQALVEAFRVDDVALMTRVLTALPRPGGELILRHAVAVRTAERAREDAAAGVPYDDGR